MEGLIFGILRYFFGFHGNKNFDIVNFLQNAFGPFVSIGSPVLSQTEGNLRRFKECKGRYELVLISEKVKNEIADVWVPMLQSWCGSEIKAEWSLLEW